MPILFLLLALLLPESSSPYPAVPFRLEETLSALWGESVLESTYILEGLLWFDQDGLYLSLTSFSPKGGKKSVFDPPLSTSLSFPDLSMEEASEEIVENDPSKPPLEEELSGERRDDPDKSLENEEEEKVVEPDPSKPSLEEELSEERRDDPDKSLENEEDEKVVEPDPSKEEKEEDSPKEPSPDDPPPPADDPSKEEKEEDSPKEPSPDDPPPPPALPVPSPPWASLNEEMLAKWMEPLGTLFAIIIEIPPSTLAEERLVKLDLPQATWEALWIGGPEGSKVTHDGSAIANHAWPPIGLPTSPLLFLPVDGVATFRIETGDDGTGFPLDALWTQESILRPPWPSPLELSRTWHLILSLPSTP